MLRAHPSEPLVSATLGTFAFAMAPLRSSLAGRRPVQSRPPLPFPGIAVFGTRLDSTLNNTSRLRCATTRYQIARHGSGSH